MTVSKEAIEAAERAFVNSMCPSRPMPLGNQIRQEALSAALTAALPFLAPPAPSQSDGRKMIWNDGRACWLSPDGSHRGITKADAEQITHWQEHLAAVRAEATLAGAAAKREACAKLIEENSILFCSEGPNQLRPRMDGDRTGLDYAAAIRGGEAVSEAWREVGDLQRATARLTGTLAEERSCRAIEVDLNNDQLIEAERIIGLRNIEIAALREETKLAEQVSFEISNGNIKLVAQIAALREALTQIEAWPRHTRDDLADTVQRMQATALAALSASPAPDPAEAMRAKCTGKTSTCYCWEPIEGTHLARTCRGSGQCLAALKGNGEGEE